MDDDSLHSPQDIIQLHCNELKEVPFKKFVFNSGNSWDNYWAERFTYRCKYAIITVCDLFFGTEKRLEPKPLTSVTAISRFVYLSQNRAFLNYSPNDKSTTTYAAIVSLNFDTLTYEFVGDPVKLPNCRFLHSDQIFYQPEHGLIIGCLHEFRSFNHPLTVHIYKFDKSLSLFYVFKSFEVPRTANYFHSINNRIVFANPDRYLYSTKRIIGNFMWLEDDYSLKEIENTKVYLKPDFTFDAEKGDTSIQNVDACWHATKFFYFFHLNYFEPPVSKRKDGEHSFYYPMIPFLFLFDWEQRAWSELRFNWPTNEFGNYRLKVDSNGILNVLTYRASHMRYTSYAPMKYDVGLLRMPLRKPDKLCILVLFQARASGFLNKHVCLRNVVLKQFSYP